MSFVNLGQIVWPIGSIYISYNNVLPTTIFGGSWASITGKFLYCNNSIETGGTNSKVYDFNHNHLHTHTFTGAYANGNGLFYTNGGTVSTSPVLTSTSSYSGSASGALRPSDSYGGGKAIQLGEKTIDTMPAYQTLYAWRRTA